MKLIITESKYKHILFKVFDKLGGKVDDNLISLFKLEGNKGAFTYDQAYKYLIEWRGEKESKELAKTLLLQNPHHIDEYGTYDFFFEVNGIGNWYLDSSQPNVVVRVKVDDMAGTVDMDGVNISLEKALDNDDYGWEVSDEVNWGIDSPKYSSRVFNFN
jgi:hypothetical protein